MAEKLPLNLTVAIEVGPKKDKSLHLNSVRGRFNTWRDAQKNDSTRSQDEVL